ncbi:MAG TPA: hypothetical protein V6C63_07695 [Allocoleopsis sp.]
MEDYADAIAEIQIYSTALNINWESPEIKAWLTEKVGTDRREKLNLEQLNELLKYLQRGFSKRPIQQIFLNHARHKFGQWEQMMLQGRTPPATFAREVGSWMTEYEQFPEVQAEIKNLIAQRRKAA